MYVKGSSKIQEDKDGVTFFSLLLHVFNRICRIIAKNIRQSSGFFVGNCEVSSLAGFKISLLGFFSPPLSLVSKIKMISYMHNVCSVFCLLNLNLVTLHIKVISF